MVAARSSVFSWHRLVSKANAAHELAGALIISIRWGRQQGATTLTDGDLANWVFRLEQALATLVYHDGESLAPRSVTLAAVQAHLAIRSIVRDAALRSVGRVTLKAYKSAAISVRDAVACCLGAAVGIASHKAYSTAADAAYGGAVQNDSDLYSQLQKAYYHFFGASVGAFESRNSRDAKRRGRTRPRRKMKMVPKETASEEDPDSEEEEAADQDAVLERQRGQAPFISQGCNGTAAAAAAGSCSSTLPWSGAGPWAWPLYEAAPAFPWWWNPCAPCDPGAALLPPTLWATPAPVSYFGGPSGVGGQNLCGVVPSVDVALVDRPLSLSLASAADYKPMAPAGCTPGGSVLPQAAATALSSEPRYSAGRGGYAFRVEYGVARLLETEKAASDRSDSEYSEPPGGPRRVDHLRGGQEGDPSRGGMTTIEPTRSRFYQKVAPCCKTCLKAHHQTIREKDQRISELATDNARLRRLGLAQVNASPCAIDYCFVHEVYAKLGELQQAAAYYQWGAEAEAAMGAAGVGG